MLCCCTAAAQRIAGAVGVLASVGVAYFAVVQGKESDEEKQLKDLEIQKGLSPVAMRLIGKSTSSY